MVLPMRVVFLVPRREDHGHRDRLWAACRARWEALFPEWPIVEGHHDDGPWNRAAALNEAARLAGDWDVAVVIDADVMLEPWQAREAVGRAARTGKAVWGHRRWRDLTQEATERLLDLPGQLLAPDLGWLGPDVRKETPLSWSCCIAVPRAAWERVGGFDERFRGWGGEDRAFAEALVALVNGGRSEDERVDGVVWNLWHPRGHRAIERTPDYVSNMRLANRYSMALRRDHHMHDRWPPAPASEGKEAQDMHNIAQQDASHSAQARALGLPDWDGWWPTMEELVARTGPIPSVALVVHTGGDATVWPERRGYLRRTLASLSDRLVLPRWERRVVLSDWGEEPRLELDAIAAEHGFYVKDLGRDRGGSGVRLGYTGSMRAEWRYVQRFVRARYVFRSEDDFELDRDVDVAAMAEALSADPRLAQMALLRDANERERAVGGFVLDHPREAFVARPTHLEHQRFFTCNPSLMRTATFAEHMWPDEDPQGRQGSETVYSRKLFRHGLVSGLWGQGERWVTHLGEVRAGGPY